MNLFFVRYFIFFNKVPIVVVAGESDTKFILVSGNAQKNNAQDALLDG